MLLRFDFDRRGDLRDPTVAARGVPADDFAIDREGSIYLTTHIVDRIVRIDPDGRRAIVADLPEQVVGAIDCALAEGAKGRRMLCVVTDGGGPVSQGPDIAGLLVAVDTTGP